MRKNIIAALTLFLMTAAASSASSSDFQNYLQSSFDKNVESLTNSSFIDFIAVFRNNSDELNRMYGGGLPRAEIKKNSKLFKDAGFLVVEKRGKLFSYPDYANVMIVPGIDKIWKDYLSLQIKLKPRDDRTPEQIRNLLISIDGFLKKNPDFPDNDFLKTQYLQLTKTYLFEDDDKQIGSDNKYKKEYTDSYKKLNKRNSSLLIAPAINEFDELLKSRDYEADYDFVRSQKDVYAKKISELLGLKNQSAPLAVTEKPISDNESKGKTSTEATPENTERVLNASQTDLPKEAGLEVGVQNKEREAVSNNKASMVERLAVSSGKEQTTKKSEQESNKTESSNVEFQSKKDSSEKVQTLFAQLQKEPLHQFSPIETLQMYGELMHVKKNEFKNYQAWLTLFNERIKEYGCFIVPDESEQVLWRGGIVRDVEKVGKCPSQLNRIRYDKASNKSLCRFACISTKGLDNTDRVSNPYISFRRSSKKEYAAISSRGLIEAVLSNRKALNDLGYRPETVYFFNAVRFSSSPEDLDRLKKQSSNFTKDTYWLSENTKLPVFKKSFVEDSLLTEDFIEQRNIDKALYEASLASEKKEKEERERLAEEKKARLEQEQKKVKELAPTYKGEFLGVFTPGETSLALFEEVLRLRGCDFYYGRPRKAGSAEACFKLPHGDVRFSFDRNKIASEATIRIKGEQAIKTYLDQLTKNFGPFKKESKTDNPEVVNNQYIWRTPKLVVTIDERYANRKAMPSYLASQVTDEAIRAEALGIVTVVSALAYEEAAKKELEEQKQQMQNFQKLF